MLEALIALPECKNLQGESLPSRGTRLFFNLQTPVAMKKQRQFVLPEKELPSHYYNIVADMPNKPQPPLHPATREPIGPEALAPLRPC